MSDLGGDNQNDVINGWVNPRYLDLSWYTQCTVSTRRKSVSDIPCLLVFNKDMYESAKLTNFKTSMADLKNQITELKKQIKELRKDRIAGDIKL